MTRIIWDGFDRWGANYNLASKWDSNGPFNSGGFSGGGPFGDGKYLNYDFQGSVTKNFTSASQIAVGMHSLGTGTGGAALDPIFTLKDGSTNQVTGCYNPVLLRYELRSGTAAGTVLAATPSGIGGLNLWDWVEFVVTLGTGTSGACEIWRYGTRLANVSSINTAPSGVAQANVVVAGAGSGIATGGISQHRIDNFYALTVGAGSAPWNARLGECRAFILKPSANSAVQWTPSSGSNWQRVSNATIDDSLNQYNSDNVVGHEDKFTHAGLPGGLTGSVFGLWHSIRHRKDDAGAHTVYTLQKNGSGGTQTNDTPVAVGNSYDDAAMLFDINPATSAAYTISEINALIFGYGVDS